LRPELRAEVHDSLKGVVGEEEFPLAGSFVTPTAELRFWSRRVEKRNVPPVCTEQSPLIAVEHQQVTRRRVEGDSLAAPAWGVAKLANDPAGHRVELVDPFVDGRPPEGAGRWISRDASRAVSVCSGVV